MGKINRLNISRLGKSGSWIALGVFLVIILVTFQGLFSSEIPTSLNTEYRWSVDVSQGMDIYPDEESGFIEGRSNAYMPIYFLVVGNLMKVFGTSPIVGKTVSTLAALGIALLIYLVSIKLTDRKLLSIVPGVLFLLYPAIGNYSAEQVKIDILGLFLAVIGLYLVFNRHYLWAVPFAVLAFFTKQYFIAVPIVTVVYLAWKERRILVKYVGLYLVLVGMGFGIGQYVTEGTFFTHTVLYLFAPQFGSLTFDRNVMGTLLSLGYLTPVLVIAVYGMWKSREFGFLGVYLVVSLLIMVVTVGKVGSGLNYSFSALVASCCLSSLVLKKGGV